MPPLRRVDPAPGRTRTQRRRHGLDDDPPSANETAGGTAGGADERGRAPVLEQGFGPTTIEQTTAAAHVAKGTFYLYFKSKEEVRAGLEERFARDHLARVQAAGARKREKDWRGKLSAWAMASVSFYLDSIRLHDVLFYEGRSPTREGLTDNIVITDLADLLRRGAEAGSWSIADARSAAVFLFCGIHGVVDHAYSTESKVNRERRAPIIR